MSNLSKVMECKSCSVTGTVTLMRNIGSTGASYVFWKCNHCLRNAGGSAKWLPHQPIIDFGIEIESIPVNKDDRVEVCAVCGDLGAQEHHWMPKHIMGDDEAEMWPKSYLCQFHHTLWHQKLTPNMSQVRHE